MLILKQSTSVKIAVGPFVDATDNVTPETGVTLGAADQAEILKHDASAVTDISSNTWAAITSADGWYNLTLSTTDTNTVGMLRILVQDSSVCLPVTIEAMIVPANVYDSLVGGSDSLEVDATAISGDTTAADRLEEASNAAIPFTVSTGSTTTTTVTTLTEATDDHYNGRTAVFLTGALAGQALSVTDYNGTTKTLTHSTATEAASNSDTGVLV